jgi:hypothetical protein
VHLGSRATFDALVAVDGRFWWRIDGALPEEARFDGRDLSVRDVNGTVNRPIGRDAIIPRIMGALLGAGLQPGAAWAAGRASFPRTSAVAELGGDADSAWAVVETLSGRERLVGRQARSKRGAPGYLSITRTIGNRVQTSITIDSVELISDGFPDPLDTDGPPLRISFPDDRPHQLEAKRAPTGQMLIKARIGSEPRWWVFDTGASEAVVDAGFASQLGVAPVGESLVTSMFGQELGKVYRIPRLELGAVAVEGMAAVATDLKALSGAVSEPLAGILGFELLSRSIVEFEVGEGRVSIGSPASAPTVEWFPLELLDRHPVLEGAIERLTGRLRLDTGAGPGLIVNRWVSETNGFMAGRSTSPIAGTPFEARVGSVEQLRVGGYTTGPVGTLFVMGGGGPIAAVFNDRDLLGNVGAEVLGRLRAVFDYQRGRIALVPTS